MANVEPTVSPKSRATSVDTQIPDVSIGEATAPFDAMSDSMPCVTSNDCRALFGVDNGVISSPVRTAPDCAMGTPDDWASRSHAPPSTVPPTTVSTSAMACTRAMASCSIATTV